MTSMPLRLSCRRDLLVRSAWRDALVTFAFWRDLLVRSAAPGARIHPNSAGTTSVPLRVRLSESAALEDGI